MGTRLLLLLTVALATLGSGKAQTCEKLSADIVFLVDWSAKLSLDDTTNLKTILKSVVTDKYLGKSDNRLGLVWFSDNAQVGFNLAECNMDVSCMQQKIDQAPIKGGRSNFAAAVETARTKIFGNQGDRPGNKNIYIFISDGTFYGDKSMRQKLSDELALVNAANGRIAAIVVGEKLNTGFFAERVSEPHLLNLYASFSYEKLKNDYMIENWLSILCKDEAVVNRTLTAKDCEEDIVLMIDVSGSIIDNENKVISNWYHLVTFMENFMKTVADKYPDVRLALMYFNDAPSTKFNFNDCQYSGNVTCMVDTIHPETPPEFTTDMRRAFKWLNDEIINSKHNRPDVKDLVIFMTDGFPNPDDVGKSNDQIIAEIKEEADKVAIRGVKPKIMGIAVTKKTNEDMIRQVVSEPKDHYLKVFGSYLDLTNDVLGVIDTGCTRKGEQCQAKIDLVILVDWSSKIANEVENVKASLRTLFDLSRIGRDHVMIAIGLIGSNTDPIAYLGSCTNNRCLKDRLSRARAPSGKADIARALVYASDTLVRSGGRSDARDVVMLITDNMADQDQDKVKAAADNLKKDGIRLSVASVTEYHDSSLLTAMVTWPFDDHMFTAISYQGLNELFAFSWEKNCDGYSKVIIPPPPPPRTKFNCVADIILLVDKSVNLVQEPGTSGRQTLINNWVYLQEFIKELVTTIQTVYKDQIRVALIYFDDQPTLRFNLGECENATCLEAAFRSSYPSGGVNLAAALQMATDDVIGSQGDRDSVNNIIIVVTDGFPPQPAPGLERPSINIGHVIKENYMTKILGVGVNLNAQDSDAMYDLVSNPPSYYDFKVQSYSELYQKHNEILQRACDSQDKCNLTSDSVFLVEWSNRISDRDAKFIRYYLRDLINKVEVGAQNFKIAIIWVNEQATLGLDLNACADDACLIKHVMTHQHPRTGQANFKLAFEKAVTIFKGPGTRPGATDSILAVMDGRMQNKAEMMEAANTAKALPARLAIVPVGTDIDQDFHDMVSQPWTLNYFPADHWPQISKVVNTMWDRICVTTIPTPEPTVEPEEDAPDCLIDLALLVDHSGSIIGDEKRIMHNWYDLKKFLVDFITDIKNRYKTEVKISLTFFAGLPDLKFNFGQCPDLACMVDYINGKRDPFGTTNMPKAFEFIQTEVFGSANDRKNVSDVLVFLTDGFPYPFIKSEVENMFRIIDNLKRQEVTIFPIGVTDKVNEDLLKRVASNPGELMHQAGNFRELVEKTAKLVRDTCNARCKGAACDSALDIALLIDTSSKMMTGFTELGVRRMVQYLITCARVDPNKVHLALIYYHSRPEILMNLGSCADQACVRRESSKPIPTGTASDLAGALQFVREQVFNGRGGDRKEAPNKLLIITNSEPDISDTAIMSEGELLKKDGTFIHGLGIGQNLSHLGFRRLVSGPDHYRYDSTIVGLRSHVASMKKVLCGTGKDITVINFNESSTCLYDINLLVDFTASLTTEQFLYIQEFLIRFVTFAKSKHIETVITLVTVYQEIEVVINFDTCNGNTDVPCMLELIRKLPLPQGNPDLMKAFDVVVKEVFARPENNPQYRDVTLLITDGFILPFNPRLFQVAEEVRESGIKVMGIGLGEEVNLAILRAMTSEPKDKNAMSFMFDVLASNAEAMVHKVCSIEESECRTPGDIIFVLDSSGSIGPQKFEMGKEFIINLINMFPVEKSGIQIGVIQFSSTSELIFNLNKFKTKAEMIDAVRAIKYMGTRTNTPSALRYVRQTMLTTYYGDRPNSPNVVIVITDGGSNEEWQEDTITEAVRLHEKATTFVVQVGKWVNEYELKAIASHPYSKHRLEVEDYDKLNTIVFDIVDLACHNTDPCSGVVCQNGGTPVDTWRGCLCVCPEGYSGVDCSDVCSEEADVIFAVDKSASMHNRDLLTVVDFLRNTTENLNFGMHRIGLMSFSDRPEIHLHVDQVAVKDVVLDMLDIYHKGGKTDTAEALRTIRTQMFTRSKIRRKSNGDEVARIVVLIIDGKSSNRQTTWTEAQKLREEGVHILVVGIGDGVRQVEMEGIASEPYGGGIIRLQTFSELQKEGYRILNALCNNGGDCSKCPDGSTCVTAFGNSECKPCPAGFSGPECAFGCDAKMDLGLLLDVSGSIRAYRFEKIQKFVAEVLSNMTIGPDDTRVGAVSWSDSAKRQFSLNQYKYAQDVIHAVRSIQFQGRRTNTQNALDSMRNVFREIGERPDAPNKILMITDGGSNIRQDETIPKATTLKKDTGAHIAIVAIGDDMNMRELKGMASQPAEANIFEVETENDLDKFVPLVAKAFCDDVNECIPNRCQNGGTCVDMLRSYQCTCPDGWAGVHCTKECRNSHDIALVLDVSGSVQNIYDIIMTFSRRLVLALPVHNGRTRVGMVTFDDRSSVKFRLTDHRTRNDILLALTLERWAGSTNMYSGLISGGDILRSGGRNGVQDTLVLVTDGLPTVEIRRTPEAAQRVKDRDVRIVTVAVGSETDRDMLTAIASDPKDENLISILNKGEIDAAVDAFLDLVCTQ